MGVGFNPFHVQAISPGIYSSGVINVIFRMGICARNISFKIGWAKVARDIWESSWCR